MKPTLILRAQELRKHARKIADAIARAHPRGCCVIKRPAPNPTLVAHGLVRASLWHITTADPPVRAVADLYVGNHAEAARITRLLANMMTIKGEPARLRLLDNKTKTAELKAHPRSAVEAMARNPSRSHAARGRRRAARIIKKGGRTQAQRLYRQDSQIARRAPRIATIRRMRQDVEATSVRDWVRELKINQDDAYRGRITFDQFDARQKSIWSAIKKAGATALVVAKLKTGRNPKSCGKIGKAWHDCLHANPKGHFGTQDQSDAVDRLRRYAAEYGLEVVTAGLLSHGAVHVDYRDPKKRGALRAIILPNGIVQGSTRLVEANSIMLERDARRANPKGRKTIREGVAILLESGGFKLDASQVRSGKVTPMSALATAVSRELSMSGGPRPKVLAALRKAIALVERAPNPSRTKTARVRRSRHPMSRKLVRAIRTHGKTSAKAKHYFRRQLTRLKASPFQFMAGPKANPKGRKLKVGDRVQFTAAHLRSAGLVTGPYGRMVGTITAIETNWSTPKARVEWDGFPEMSGPDRLPVDVKALKTVGHREANPIDDDPRQFSVGDIVSISAVPYFGRHGTVVAIGKVLVTVEVHLLGKRVKFRAGDLRLANPKGPIPLHGHLSEAFADWVSGRAYVDNAGNYKLRAEKVYRGGAMRFTGRGKTAPWNREAKRAFPSVQAFHVAANALARSGELTPNPKGRNPAPRHRFKTGDRFRLIMDFTTMERQHHQNGELGTVTLPTGSARGGFYGVFDSTPYWHPEFISDSAVERSRGRNPKGLNHAGTRIRRGDAAGRQHHGTQAHVAAGAARGSGGRFVAAHSSQPRVGLNNPPTAYDSSGARHQGLNTEAQAVYAERGLNRIGIQTRGVEKRGRRWHVIIANPSKLTLREWSEKYGIDMRQKGGAHWVPDSFVHGEARSELWNLSDYLVSSVSGGTIWLVKRRVGNPMRRNRTTGVRRGVRGSCTSRPRARATVSAPRRHPNPATRDKAAQLVRMFEDRGPIKVRTKRIKAPKPLAGSVAKIGDVVAIAYRSKKFDGKSKDYEHKFSSPKPVLVADPESGDLNIVRGKSPYDLTPDGIIN